MPEHIAKLIEVAEILFKAGATALAAVKMRQAADEMDCISTIRSITPKGGS